MYLHKTKNGHYTPPCCYFSGELEVVECLPQTFSGGLMVTALKKDFTKEQLKETIAYQAMSRIGILYREKDCALSFGMESMGGDNVCYKGISSDKFYLPLHQYHL